MGAAFVDCHVHYYDSYDPNRFLDAAAENLSTAARRHGCQAGDWIGCMLLADHPRAAGMERLALAARDRRLTSWRLATTDEDSTLTVQRDDGVQLHFLGGRQIVTREKLEVLALGCSCEISAGLSATDTLQQANACGAIPVLPWGLGKWWFRRGALLRELIEAFEHGKICRFFLGDNGGRPRCSTSPAIFRRGAAAGLKTLPGSDPLPVSGGERNAGRLGIVLPEFTAGCNLVSTIAGRLDALREQPQTFGNRVSLRRFCREQALLRLRP